MNTEQKQNMIQRWKELSKLIGELFEIVFKPVLTFIRMISRQPASAVEIGSESRLPLSLNLQFFAEPTDGDDDPENQDDPTDPPDGDDEYIPLADLIKLNPKLKQEVSARINKAVMKRFKDIDPEEARLAIAEKRERDSKNKKDPPAKDPQDDAAIIALNSKTSKLEAKTKKLAVLAYASSKGLDSKLITALAGSKIEKLALDEDFEVDNDDIEEIVEQLRVDFPKQFPVDDLDDFDDTEFVAVRKKGGLNSSREKTNQNRVNGKVDQGILDVEESFNRIKDRYNY